MTDPTEARAVVGASCERRNDAAERAASLAVDERERLIKRLIEARDGGGDPGQVRCLRLARASSNR